MASFWVILVIYSIVSTAVFYLVYNASQLVIDEEFHLRQGREYCDFNFHIWDPKITTFPGLYLIASMLGPFYLCNTIALRLTSLVASIINVSLIYEIRRHVCQRVHPIKIAVETLILATLPPMYLFAHLYYTDIVSVTMTLAMLNFSIKQRHGGAAFFGALSVLMRQTNIVWVAYALGTTAIDKLVSQTLPFLKDKKRSSSPYSFQDLVAVIGFYCKRYYLVPKQIRLLSAYLFGYISIIIAFIVFVVVNGSIVVGDKSAHQAAVHLPQLLYFSLFFVVFSPAMFLTHITSIPQIVRAYWHQILLFSFLCAVCVTYNTIAHPYLLADNRHYVFYMWNRFYGKYWWARYAMIPAYTIAALILLKVISARTAGFQLVFIVCTTAAIALQQLIELRYFIVPFLIVRLLSTSPRSKWLLLELIFYVAVNGLVFYLFTTKEIHWDDYDAVQRLIW